MSAAAAFTSRIVLADDGLRLHARDYGHSSSRHTVLCLPGLARTAADFDPVARHLIARDPGRRVVALDYRGRGGSDWDPDPTRYSMGTEAGDILKTMAALDIAAPVVVGTSRGGLHAMGLAAVRPGAFAGVVLNDIGPVLEPIGLTRIKGYVGRMPTLATWEEAVAALRRVAGGQFTGLTDEAWMHYARTTYAEGADGRLAARYDPGLGVNLAALDPGALPAMWEAFDALKATPLMVIRGETSDLLSPATALAMAARHPDCTVITVAGQGHAPLLADPPTLAAIEGFVARCEAARPPGPGEPEPR